MRSWSDEPAGPSGFGVQTTQPCGGGKNIPAAVGLLGGLFSVGDMMRVSGCELGETLSIVPCGSDLARGIRTFSYFLCPVMRIA
jgi:hypothetical protein